MQFSMLSIYVFKSCTLFLKRRFDSSFFSLLSAWMQEDNKIKSNAEMKEYDFITIFLKYVKMFCFLSCCLYELIWASDIVLYRTHLILILPQESLRQ